MFHCRLQNISKMISLVLLALVGSTLGYFYEPSGKDILFNICDLTVLFSQKETLDTKLSCSYINAMYK